MHEHLLYYFAAVPLLGILAQWLAWRLRLPSILLLLIFGVLLGYGVKRLMGAEAHDGELIPDDILFPIVSLSVAVILFEGGLTLRYSELKEATGSTVLRLVTLGALVTWALASLAAWAVLGLPLRIAVLIGAVLVVTGPTVIVPLLRHVRPSKRIGAIAKWEGIVIDPVGAVAAVLVFEAVLTGGTEEAAGDALMGLLKTVVFGVAIGVALALLLIQLIKRYWVPQFLDSPVFLTVALAGFALTNYLQAEAGLVTVTVMGIVLANQKDAPVKHIVEFKENLQVLLISCLFIVLGSRIDLASIHELGWQGALFVAVLIVVVRPLSVLFATVGGGLKWREVCFLSFLAPRGIVAAAVASVFAFQLAASGKFEEGIANQFVSITFLVIISTVAVYGLLAAPLARWLKLSEPTPQGMLIVGAQKWVREVAKLLQGEEYQVVMIDTNYPNVAAAKMEGLDAHCLSILSEYATEEIDLNGIGRLLAMTSNDEVNTLAVHEFASVFGRKNVYQLTPWDTGTGKRQSVSEHLRGRMLFATGLHHDKLANMMEHGAKLKKTRLTEEFTIDHFIERYGPSTVILFVIDKSEKLKIRSADDSADYKPGQTVIALVVEGVQASETNNEA